MNENELIELLKQIVAADKTPEYEYGTKNAKGDRPGAGQRWATPSEICRDCLRELEN